jgi:acyl-CoA thioester hydrolase
MAHSLKVKVYYEDTDAGGVVYYANYLRYLERARTEFLAERGIVVAEYFRNGLLFVVSRVDIRYRHPARLGEVIEVTTEIREMKGASMDLSHRVLRDGELLAEAEVTLACTDAAGKPRRLPEDLRSLGEDG